MSFLGVKIPHEIGRLFSQVDYGGYGKPEPTDSFHVTVAYFGEDILIEKIAQIVTSTYRVASGTKPFTVQTNRLTVFPPHPTEGTVPVICRVESDALHELHDALLRQYDVDGVEYSQTFHSYTPHVTLAYTSPGDGAEDVEGLDETIPTIEWGVGELVLWGGDEGDSRISVNFPFALGPTKKEGALYRAMVRAALLHQSSVSSKGLIAHERSIR